MAAREARVWTCPVCDTRIVGCRQVAKHEELLKKGLCRAPTPGQQPVAIITTPVVIPARATREPMFSRRSRMLACERRHVDQLPATQNRWTRDMQSVQDDWERYVAQVGSQFTAKFWVFFLSMHEQSTVAIDAALTGVKKVFVAQRDLNQFASSKRLMLKRIQQNVEPFFPRVSHCVTIDLSPCGVDQKLKFRFLDPVWAWILAACKLPPEDIHFVPAEQRDHTGERMYGGGVEYGECFAEAYASCPEGAFPMLINLHWDGTAAHGLPATPIAVGVANCNTQCADAHTCIGYMPTCSVSLSSQGKTNMKFHIRQKCVGAILSVLESAARTGVTCRIGGQTYTLFPRLIAMTLDQPESQLYFGQQNGLSCLHCRRRKGRSAQRKATAQEGSVVNTLYNIVEDVNLEHRETMVKLATQRLARYGWNAKRRCLLPQICSNLLIRLPDTDDVFHSVYFRDVMHAAVIFFHRQLFEMFDYIRFSPKEMNRRVVDERVRQISSDGSMRDEKTNRSYRTQTTLFSEAHMSAADRLCILFLIPHVLGHQGTVLPQDVRAPVLEAVATVQQILIALTGQRPYTLPELQQIFDRGYVRFFTCLETVYATSMTRTWAAQQRKHDAQPDRYPAPKRFKRRTRTSKHHGANSDTESTDSENETGGLGKYSHGNIVLSHQHWVKQLIASGCFGVHNTQGAEACHKKSMRLASARVRHLDPNKTKDSMLLYLFRHHLFEELQRTFHYPTTTNSRDTPACQVQVHLLDPFGTPVELGDIWRNTDVQGRFLNSEARITRVELLDLVCGRLNLPKTVMSYKLLSQLTWTFGHKLIMRNCTYWSTDTRYPHFGTHARPKRRDVVSLTDCERVRVVLPDGSVTTKLTRLCCETVCFFTVAGLRSVWSPRHNMMIPVKVQQAFDDITDSLTFLLGRYFSPHPQATERDTHHRPICPGPLGLNHCLWKYAEASQSRSMLADPDTGEPSRYYNNQKYIFGTTPHQQICRFRSEVNAYFCVHLCSEIERRSHMTREYRDNTLEYSDTWLETVTLA